MGDFNTPLTTMDRSTKQKINKETHTLKDAMDQLGLINIYRTFHPKTINFTFFSSAHGTFSRIDHILGHKSSLSKFKKIEIILLGSDVASNLDTPWLLDASLFSLPPLSHEHPLTVFAVFMSLLF